MKSFNLKRAVALALAAALCLVTVSAFAAVAPTPGVAEPDSQYVSNENVSLSISSSGVADCYAYARAISGYTVKITVSLQYNTGEWEPYKSWTGNKGSTSVVDEDYNVLKGYTYRLKSAVKVYSSSSGALVDSYETYGNVVSY